MVRRKLFVKVSGGQGQDMGKDIGMHNKSRVIYSKYWWGFF